MAVYNDSPLRGTPNEFFDKLYNNFDTRLQRAPVHADEIRRPSKVESIPEIKPLRPRLASSHSVDETFEIMHYEVKPRSTSQPDIRRRSSRPTPPAQRISNWSNAQVESDIAEEPQADLSELEAPSSLSANPLDCPPELGRTESVTTASTSTGYRSYSGNTRNALSVSEKMTESLPEPVTIIDHNYVRAPSDYEKSYPEVAVNSVTPIQVDNLSLFSESDSVPMTTRSGSRVTNQKRFNLFKGGKRSSGGFTSPTVRFFASGKQMIAWTKYGGVCFDVANLDNPKTFPINFGGIVLAAGGTRKFGIVARYQEVRLSPWIKQV